MPADPFRVYLEGEILPPRVDKGSLRRDGDIWRVPGEVWLISRLALLQLSPPKQNPPQCYLRGVFYSSLTMSYFHTGTRTIIGAEAFHCPVRDGKEWDHLAMVIRLNRLLICMVSKTANSQSHSSV